MPRGRLRQASDEGRPERARATDSPQYWVVGASWSGREDQYEDFIREGYWLLGWDEHEQPSQAAKRDRIRPGDRIAIKKISKKPNIEIRAIGVVRRIDPKDRRVHVHWLETGLHHQVYSKGCYDSIRGPFHPSDPWTREVFRLDDSAGLSDASKFPDVDGDDGLGPEGERRWRLHLMIERNRRNVERKKTQVKRDTGSLDCEACGFNFAKFYGDLGGDFCEVHHRLPLSQVDEPLCPDLNDLAIVCSNCHRMIHKTHPMMSVEKFRALLRRLGRLP
jgi:HNH endonuclease